MNKDIIIMSSSTSFTKKFNKLLKKKKLSYPIIESTGNRTIEIANQFVTEGAKIIITRGKNLFSFASKYKYYFNRCPLYLRRHIFFIKRGKKLLK